MWILTKQDFFTSVAILAQAFGSRLMLWFKDVRSLGISQAVVTGTEVPFIVEGYSKYTFETVQEHRLALAHKLHRSLDSTYEELLSGSQRIWLDVYRRHPKVIRAWEAGHRLGRRWFLLRKAARRRTFMSGAGRAWKLLAVAQTSEESIFCRCHQKEP